MIVRTPAGAVTTFDYREKAPLKSTRTMYLGEDGKINRSLTAAGYLAPGVPGTVRGLELAHKKFGKLPWKDVVAPSVTLAEGGFVISAALARELTRELQRMTPPLAESTKLLAWSSKAAFDCSLRNANSCAIGTPFTVAL